MNKSRPFWMLGKVLENIIGFDNKIRVVKLKQGNGAIEYHTISNLYPMEISCPQNDSQIVSSGWMSRMVLIKGLRIEHVQL